MGYTGLYWVPKCSRLCLYWAGVVCTGTYEDEETGAGPDLAILVCTGCRNVAGCVYTGPEWFILERMGLKRLLRGYTGLFSVPDCSRLCLYWARVVSTGTYEAEETCAGPEWAILGFTGDRTAAGYAYTGLYWCVLERTRLKRPVLGQNGLYWAILGA